MKLSKSEIEKLRKELKKHNRTMRQLHRHHHQLDSLDDFLKYKKGKLRLYTEPDKSSYREEKYHRKSEDIPSASGNPFVSNCPPKTQQYTGTLIKGIATMHKSNAVPVINEEQMQDIAKMRRN